VVEGLQKKFEGATEFVSPDHAGIDLILAMEGRATACADLNPFEGKHIFVITCAKDAEKFVGEVLKLA
jgi:hypothetical protein